MNIEEEQMKGCAVVCTVLIKIGRIIVSQLCYRSWLPPISQQIEKRQTRTILNVIITFTSLSFVLRLRDVPKKYFEYT